MITPDTLSPTGRQTIFPHPPPLCHFKGFCSWGQMNFPERTKLSQSRKLTWPRLGWRLWGPLPHAQPLAFLVSVSPSFKSYKNPSHFCPMQNVVGMGAEGAWTRTSQCLSELEALMSKARYPRASALPPCSPQLRV